MKSRHSIAANCFWLVITMILIALDRLCKVLAVNHLKEAPGMILIPGLLDLDYVENYGMAFGLLEGGRILFVIFAIFFLLAAAYLIYHMPNGKKYRLISFCLTVMAAGALGNCIDRVLYGYVVDYLSVSLFQFPVFNLADIFVVCAGITLMIILLFFLDEEELSEIFRK